MRALWVAVLLSCAGCGSEEAPPSPVEPASTVVQEPAPSADVVSDRCPVCAMDPSKHPEHAATIELDDGRIFTFCGNGCMLRSWLQPEMFMEVDRVHLVRAMVHEYFEGKVIDAATATWVVGSDVVGPMGPAIVPLASDEDAAVFMERHGGAFTFRLAELDGALWRKIKGKPDTPNIKVSAP